MSEAACVPSKYVFQNSNVVLAYKTDWKYQLHNCQYCTYFRKFMLHSRELDIFTDDCNDEYRR